MTPKYLDSTLSAELDSVHQKYAPNSQLWVGEAAAAWHSGADGVTNAFTSSFWWSDALGVLAAHNHSVYCRQTLLGGNYGLPHLHHCYTCTICTTCLTCTAGFEFTPRILRGCPISTSSVSAPSL